MSMPTSCAAEVSLMSVWLSPTLIRTTRSFSPQKCTSQIFCSIFKKNISPKNRSCFFEQCFQTTTILPKIEEGQPCVGLSSCHLGVQNCTRWLANCSQNKDTWHLFFVLKNENYCFRNSSFSLDFIFRKKYSFCVFDNKIFLHEKKQLKY